MNLGFCYEINEQYEIAIEILNRVLDKFKRAGKKIDPDAFWVLGDCYANLGDYEKARSYLQQAQAQGVNYSGVKFWIRFIDTVLPTYRASLAEGPTGWQKVVNAGWYGMDKELPELALATGLFLIAEGTRSQNNEMQIAGKNVEASARASMGGNKNLEKAAKLFAEVQQGAPATLSQNYYQLLKQALQAMNLVACSRCGKLLPLGAKFCNGCGNKIT